MPVAVQGEQAQQTVDAFGGGLSGQTAQLANHGQVFEASQMRIDLRLFGHVSHAALVGHRIVLDALALEQDFPVGRLHESRNHLHGGRLA